MGGAIDCKGRLNLRLKRFDVADRLGDFGFGRVFHDEMDVLSEAGQMLSHLGRVHHGGNGNSLVPVHVTVDMKQVQQQRGETQQKDRQNEAEWHQKFLPDGEVTEPAGWQSCHGASLS